MQDSNVPVKLPAIWAHGVSSPYIRAVPAPSQIGIQNGAASLADGYPPNCFIPLAAGGAGPFGSDTNGILNQVTAGLQWTQAGGPWKYDATFQTAIGGYPKNAVVASAVTDNLSYISTVDNNVTNPDMAGAGWLIWPIFLVQNPLTYYVSPSGSDSNPGTSGSPWLTLQHAVNVIQNGFFLNGNIATINVAAGTYSAGAALSGSLNGTISFVGPLVGTATINGAGYCFSASNGASCAISGNLVLNQTNVLGSADSCLVADTGGVIQISGSPGNAVAFGSSGGYHVNAFSGGQVNLSLSPNNAYSITGSATIAHWNVQDQSRIVMNSGLIGLGGGIVFATFAVATNLSLMNVGSITFSGSATGTRYSVASNSVINTGGGGGTYLPGNSAGAAATGGQYI